MQTTCNILQIRWSVYLFINYVQVEHGVPETTEEIRESATDIQSKLVKQISESCN